jgi:hypothetical protein
MRLALGIVLLCGAACLSCGRANADTFVRYGSAGYRYAITTGDFPNGVELPNFDDSGFAVGAAPFSNGVNPGFGIYTGATYWPENTKLIARLHFDVPTGWIGSAVTLRFGIDNDVVIYVNGKVVASVTHDGEAHYDDFIVPVPQGMLQLGENLVVALAVDRGGSTAFDLSLTAAQVNPTTRLPYGSPGYRYAITTGSFPAGVELPDFDDSAYATGSAPFSNGIGPGIYTPATYWPENTKLIARLRFTAPTAPTATTLRFGIDNDVTIYLNGQLVASVVHEGGAHYDDFIFKLPDGLLRGGENLLVALAVDRGGGTAFDVSITTDTATLVRHTSWGSLKASYR